MSQTPSSVPRGGASVAASSVSGITSSLQPGPLGTESNPIVENVNVEFPEANNLFEITKVANFKYNGQLFTSWEMRKVVSGPDREKWIVRWISPTQLMVECPSQDVMLRYKYYHSANATVTKAGSSFDDATKTAHSANAVAIVNSPWRQKKYFLLNFPEGTSLNPSILSGGANESSVEQKSNVVIVPRDDFDSNDDLKSVVVYWMIAEDGGVALTRAPKMMPTLKDLGI
jgi:hypothetical protein